MVIYCPSSSFIPPLLGPHSLSWISDASYRVRACVRVSVRTCVRASERANVRACEGKGEGEGYRLCVRVFLTLHFIAIYLFYVC